MGESFCYYKAGELESEFGALAERDSCSYQEWDLNTHRESVVVSMDVVPVHYSLCHSGGSLL